MCCARGLATALVAAMGVVPQVRGDVFWDGNVAEDDSVDGAYGQVEQDEDGTITFSNWSGSRDVGGIRWHIPEQFPHFHLNAEYKVTFGASFEAQLLHISGGDVTFELGPYTYWATAYTKPGTAAFDSIYIGTEAGSQAKLILDSGTLNTTGDTPDAIDRTEVYSSIANETGSQGRVAVGQGATWINEHFFVGRNGLGDLGIEQGGTVTTQGAAIIGGGATGTGTALVGGQDSTWTTSTMTVGNSGDGTLHIVGGGQVTTTSTTHASHVGQYVGATGRVRVVGPSSWDLHQDLYVGDAGEGMLIVDQQAQVTVAPGDDPFDRNRLTIGNDAMGDGTVFIRNRATLTANSIHVGNRGTGHLGVTAGGSAMANVVIANEYGSSGDVLVSDDGSIQGDVTVGSRGTATLTIQARGEVLSNGATIGNVSRNDPTPTGARGDATVTGIGSVWTINQGLKLGTGTLQIRDQGRVESGVDPSAITSRNDTRLGERADSVSTVVVAGEGSTWSHNRGNLYVGYAGQGTMHIDGGGAVDTADNVYIGYAAGSTGSVAVTGSASSWTVDGHLDLGPFGHGTLHVADLGWTYVGGNLNVHGGNAIEFNGGGISVDGQLSICDGGTIRGVGSMAAQGGMTNAGIIAPGFSPGTINFDGDWTQVDTGTLIIELAGTEDGQFDLLTIGGNATVGGTLALRFIDGFAPQAGDTFDFLRASDTLTGAFDRITLGGLMPGWQYTVTQHDGVYRLTSLTDGQAIPEPATLALLSLGVLLTARRRIDPGRGRPG